MVNNRISAKLSEEAFARIRAAFAQIRADLPFLLDLTKEQKKALPKFGDKSIPFVNKTLEFAKEHSDVIPARLPMEEFSRDVTLYNQLFMIYHEGKELCDQINDTYLQVGAEAYSTALAVYANLQINQDLFDGSELVLDELSKRFIQKTKKDTTTEQI